MTAMELMEAIGEAEEELIEPVLTPAAKKKLSRPVRTALILAAVIALLALLGVAAKEAGLLEGLYREKFETIEDYVDHIAMSVENDGLRLTLHEAVTDGYTLLLAYSVERLDGGSMEGWTLDEIICPLTEEGYPVQGLSGSWSEPLDTGVTDPAKRTYLYRVYGWKGLGRVTFRLFGLIHQETRESFAPGYLEAEAELKPCLTKVAGPQGGAEAEKIYTEIVLSPFGLRAKVMTNITGLTEEDVARPEKPTYNDPWTGSLELVFRNVRRRAWMPPPIPISGWIPVSRETVSWGRASRIRWISGMSGPCGSTGWNTPWRRGRPGSGNTSGISRSHPWSRSGPGSTGTIRRSIRSSRRRGRRSPWPWTGCGPTGIPRSC